MFAAIFFDSGLSFYAARFEPELLSRDGVISTICATDYFNALLS